MAIKLMRFIQVFFLSFILFFALNTNAQKQMFGGGLGYTFNGYSEWEKYSGGYGDLNINYLLAIKVFAIKAKINLQPFTSFGLKYQFFGGVGITTALDKRLSFHAILGLGTGNCTNSSYNIEGARIEYNSITTAFYDFGFYFKLKKTGNFYLGLETYYWLDSVHVYDGWRSPRESPIAHITCVLSANYLFGTKEKKKPQEN